MKTLLLIAHGSRRAASNDEVRQLTHRLNAINPPGFSGVETAFLELAQPSIPEGLAACLAKGASEIVVFPYFLAAGTHVVNDIPEALQAFQSAHPQIKVSLTRHLGDSDLLPQAILQVAIAA
ncbi:MAG: cobalamin biosynthesis protein CbiX [Sulfuriferula multivorans]|uniref:Cobalamin biosynthesis protein CbiX n=1 Tax=Sulfuriferula multivorans TaxID=1559896 RepID=A0A7C9P4S0_9PROT|nr:cobalamin biosynthesis protein CbiX [Sulfuriferula multivorans]